MLIFYRTGNFSFWKLVISDKNVREKGNLLIILRVVISDWVVLRMSFWPVFKHLETLSKNVVLLLWVS